MFGCLAPIQPGVVSLVKSKALALHLLEFHVISEESLLNFSSSANCKVSVSHLNNALQVSFYPLQFYALRKLSILVLAQHTH